MEYEKDVKARGQGAEGSRVQVKSLDARTLESLDPEVLESSKARSGG